MTISCVEEIYKKYIKLAKEKTPNLFKEEHYSPHSMRHTTGQHMLEAGVPIMVIKIFLGHASVQTTQIYTESSQASGTRGLRVAAIIFPPSCSNFFDMLLFEDSLF